MGVPEEIGEIRRLADDAERLYEEWRRDGHPNTARVLHTRLSDVNRAAGRANSALRGEQKKKREGRA